MGASHHGTDPELMRQFLAQVEGRAKREYPEGRLGAHDEGSLAFAVAADLVRQVVLIDFGKPVQSLAMGPADLDRFIKLLRESQLKLKVVEAEAGKLTIPLG